MLLGRIETLPTYHVPVIARGLSALELAVAPRQFLTLAGPLASRDAREAPYAPSAVVSIMSRWNELLWPLIATSVPREQVLTLGLPSFATAFGGRSLLIPARNPAPRRKAAWSLIATLTSPAVSAGWRRFTDYFAPNRSTKELPRMKAYLAWRPYAAAAIRQLK